MNKFLKKVELDEKGSLALEHILFIAAVVAISAAVFVFYDNLGNYYKNVDVSTLPKKVTTTTTP